MASQTLRPFSYYSYTYLLQCIFCRLAIKYTPAESNVFRSTESEDNMSEYIAESSILHTYWLPLKLFAKDELSNLTENVLRSFGPPQG